MLAPLALAAAPTWAATTADASKPKAKPKAKPAAAAQPVSTAAPAAPRYAGRDDVIAFAGALAERRGWPVAWVETQLGLARRTAAVERLIMPPPAGTAKNWFAYRDRFVEPRRIEAGLAFWRRQEPWLTLAEERYGVPASIVVGIIGVETFYGRITGNFRVIDALATLSFDFPTGRRNRQDFFRSELEAFLEWARREEIDPQQPKGSFAGAMGLPQFMPSSILKHGVDFDGDGHIDLIDHPADAVGSVANYLAAFGWQRGMPTHFGVAAPVDVADRAVLLGPDILPSFSAAQFAERGAVLPAAGQAHEGLLAFVELQNGEAAPTYYAGTANFWAITRYNWSSYYAMAVISLAEAVAQAR